jgi:hypothetical protein
MSKISKTAAAMMMNKTPWAGGNTTVAPMDGAMLLILHGHPICRIWDSGVVEVCTAGWDIVTTRARLNAIDGVSVKQRSGVLYLNERLWVDHKDWTVA